MTPEKVKTRTGQLNTTTTKCARWDTQTSSKTNNNNKTSYIEPQVQSLEYRTAILRTNTEHILAFVEAGTTTHQQMCGITYRECDPLEAN